MSRLTARTKLTDGIGQVAESIETRGFDLLVFDSGGSWGSRAGSMMADVAQEHELATGKSQQGILFSAISPSGKAASGSGHLIAGWGIEWIRFPLQAPPSEVAPATGTSALREAYGGGSDGR